jgi:hypothetical protein
MYDKNNIGSITWIEVDALFRALGINAIDDEMLVECDVPQRRESGSGFSYQQFMHFLNCKPFRDSLDFSCNFHNQTYNLTCIKRGAAHVAKRFLEFEDIRLARIAFYYLEGEVPKGISASLKELQTVISMTHRCVAPKELSKFVKEYTFDHDDRVQLYELFDILTQTVSMDSVKEVVANMEQPLECARNGQTGLYQMASESFLLTPRQRLGAVLNDRYDQAQRMAAANAGALSGHGTQRPTSKQLETMHLAEHIHQRRKLVKADHSLYQDIKSQIRAVEKRVFHHKSGAQPSGPRRGKKGQGSAYARPQTAREHEASKVARQYEVREAAMRTSDKGSIPSKEMATNKLFRKIEEELAYRPLSSERWMPLDDPNVDFDVFYSQEEIIQAQEAALEPSKMKPSFIPAIHMCHPSVSEFFQDPEFSFRDVNPDDGDGGGGEGKKGTYLLDEGDASGQDLAKKEPPRLESYVYGQNPSSGATNMEPVQNDNADKRRSKDEKHVILVGENENPREKSGDIVEENVKQESMIKHVHTPRDKIDSYVGDLLQLDAVARNNQVSKQKHWQTIGRLAAAWKDSNSVVRLTSPASVRIRPSSAAPEVERRKSVDLHSAAKPAAPTQILAPSAVPLQIKAGSMAASTTSSYNPAQRRHSVLVTRPSAPVVYVGDPIETEEKHRTQTLHKHQQKQKKDVPPVAPKAFTLVTKLDASTRNIAPPPRPKPVGKKVRQQFLDRLDKYIVQAKEREWERGDDESEANDEHQHEPEHEHEHDSSSGEEETVDGLSDSDNGENQRQPPSQKRPSLTLDLTPLHHGSTHHHKPFVPLSPAKIPAGPVSDRPGSAHIHRSISTPGNLTERRMLQLDLNKVREGRGTTSPSDDRVAASHRQRERPQSALTQRPVTALSRSASQASRPQQRPATARAGGSGKPLTIAATTAQTPRPMSARSLWIREGGQTKRQVPLPPEQRPLNPPTPRTSRSLSAGRTRSQSAYAHAAQTFARFQMQHAAASAFPLEMPNRL